MNTKHILATIAISVLLQSHSAIAETIPQLIEKAIYLEEVDGNIHGAIKLYDQILDKDSAHQKDIAEALLRKGKAHALLGQKDHAISALKKIVAKYPEQAQRAKEAKQILSELRFSPVQLSPEPWVDGEKLTYTFSGPAGGQLGSFTMVTNRAQHANKEAWNIEQYLSIPMSQMISYSSVIAKKDSFLPVTVQNKYTTKKELGYTYVSSTIEFEATGKKQTLPVPPITFDTGQLYHLLRRLDIGKSTSQEISVFDHSTQSLVTLSITFDNTESVKTSLGEIECHILTIVANNDEAHPLSSRVAISNDNKRYVVRHTSNAFNANISKANNIKIEAQGKTILKNANVSYTVSRDSIEHNISFVDPSMVEYIEIASPKLKSISWLAIKKIPSKVPGLNVQRVTDSDINLLKSYFKNYVVRKDSRASLVIDTLPAEIFHADYELLGVKMVESRVYILGKDHVYWFIRRTKKENFEHEKLDFENLYLSFKRTTT